MNSRVLNVDAEGLRGEFERVPRALALRLLGQLATRCKVSDAVLLDAMEHWPRVIQLHLREMLLRVKAVKHETQ
jgi:hypothetical protein